MLKKVRVSLTAGVVLPGAVWIVTFSWMELGNRFSNLVFDLFYWPTSLGLSYPSEPGIILLIGYVLDSLIIALFVFTVLHLISRKRAPKKASRPSTTTCIFGVSKPTLVVIQNVVVYFCDNMTLTVEISGG